MSCCAPFCDQPSYLAIHVQHMHNIMPVSKLNGKWAACTTDTASSSLTRFDGSKCEDNCVYSTDPLLFTCELNHVLLLRVKFPNGYREAVSVGDTLQFVALPAGFSAVSLNISNNACTRNITLKILIANASLLDGGEITCDDSESGNNVTAGCRLCGKF